MNINNAEHDIQGMTVEEIGQLLLNSSPNKDGLGINAVFTVQEHLFLEAKFGSFIGQDLFGYVVSAIQSGGGYPTKICSVYDIEDRRFRTYKKTD